MLKSIFKTLLVVACLLTGCTKNSHDNEQVIIPVLTSINIVDRNGMTETVNGPDRLAQYSNVDFLEPQSFQRVLRIYSRDGNGNIPACITSYHSNGYPQQYLEIMNSRASGSYKEWHQNGIQKIDAYILEGDGDIVEGSEKTWIFDGDSEVWREDGSLEAIIPYSKGSLEGVANYYHPCGTVWKIIPYKNNLINGSFEAFKSDGTLLYKANYVQGALHGEALRYWNPDQISAKETFCEGLLVDGLYYDIFGNLICSIEDGNGMKAIFGKETVTEFRQYRFGILEGEIKTFDSQGRTNKIYHVKNNCKHGEELTFYDGMRLQKVLTPKLSINWYDGKIQGVAKTWYDNGTQESQKELSNNKRNGHSMAWYRDGSLMYIEQYESDKLIRGEYYSKGEKYPVSEIKEGKGVATLYDGEGNFIRKVNYHNSKPLIDD